MTAKTAGKRFAVIGVAGYIARRHLDAIRAVGGDIVAAFDVFDSVGQMNDFTKARFFTDFTEFESFVLRAKRDGRPIDYVSICSPNYLHDAHVALCLALGRRRHLREAAGAQSAQHCRPCPRHAEGHRPQGQHHPAAAPASGDRGAQGADRQ